MAAKEAYKALLISQAFAKEIIDKIKIQTRWFIKKL